jgi:hypothetical protein
MADISDVTTALASLAANALYPNGIAQPSAAGVTVTVAAGWPVPAQLDAIIKSGHAMLTVYSMPGMDANTTRFAAQMVPKTAIPAASLILTVSGNQVTVGGAIKSGEAAAVQVNYQTYSAPVASIDTTATIAAALAALIPNASAAGSVVTVAGAFDIAAVVSVPVGMQSEVGRQCRVFKLVAWCPSDAVRALLVPAVDVAFRQMPRILMPDNTYARMIYRGTVVMDDIAKQKIYRRDLHYEVEYSTTATETDNTVTSFGASLTPTNGTTKTINL